MVYLPTITPAGAYTFNMTVVNGQTYFIDPSIATGYTYATGAGNPNFTSVLLPAIQTTPYTVSFQNNGVMEADTVAPNTVFTFPTGGVNTFTVTGVNVADDLDPANATAFVTGLTFVSSGSFTGTQTPIVILEVADMIMRDGNNGDYQIYDINDNTITSAALWGQVGPEWQVAGVGGFYGTDNSDMILRDSSTGVFLIYHISNNAITKVTDIGQFGPEWAVAGFGDFSGNANETDMLMRDSYTGQFEIYDIGNNAVTSAAPMGQVGLESTVAGFGDFSGNPGETDMLMRNSNTGAFEVYDISHNAVTSAAPMGQVGLEWTVAGFGDFSGNANETDMLMRNSSTGAFEYYDISHNVITAAGSLAVTYPMGTVASQWTVAGFGDFSGNANETDMLMQATSDPDAGDFELYDISYNAITSAASMGQVGSEWTVAGFAADPPAGSLGGSTALLVQAMAPFGANAAVNSVPGAVLGGADTSQQALLAIPHQT